MAARSKMNFVQDFVLPLYHNLSTALQQKLKEVRLTTADLQGMVVPFLLCNGACVSLACMCYKLTFDGLFFGFMGAYLGLCFRALAVVAYLTFVQMKANNGKNRIHQVNNSEEGPIIPQLLQFFKLALFEAAVIFSASRWDSLIINDSPYSFIMQWVLFIPKSFFWEITFDFFHYWTHRAAHMDKRLYMLLHYDHHLHEKPGPLSTFIMTTEDFVLTNIIPAALAFHLLGLKFTLFQLHLLMTYKTSVEIGGHSGIDDDNWHSFMQFPLLPRLFPELLATAGDHDLHHSRKTINFAKRFKLWDIVFGTYDSRKAVLKKRLSRRIDIRLSILGLERGQSFDNLQEKKKENKTSSSPQPKLQVKGKSKTKTQNLRALFARERSLSASSLYEAGLMKQEPKASPLIGQQGPPRRRGLTRQRSFSSLPAQQHLARSAAFKM